MRPVNQPPVPPLPPLPDAAGHLALPLLRQYVAGTLPAATQHRIEAHTLSCTRCAEILEGLQVSDSATTDAALQQLQARLHQRLAQAEAPHRTRQLWQAAAAVLLLLLVSTAVWWQVRRPQAAPASAPVAGQVPPASPVASPAPPAAAAEAEVAASTETTDAVALATPAARPAARRAAPVGSGRPRTSRPAAPKAAAATVAPEAATATIAAMAADEAPAAMAMRVAPSADTASKVVPAVADTGAATVATLGRSAQRVAEESVARKAVLPKAPAFSPQPVGGYIGLREYLRREGMFVPEPPARQLSGSVRVQFTVTAAGKLENFRILRGIRADYDAEAIRLLCEGPAWQPGTANGRRADQIVEINISF